MSKQIGLNKLSDVKIRYIQNHLQGTSIMDVGCGQGHYSHWLATTKPSLNINAIDHLACSEAKPYVYHQLDLENPLPFSNQSADTILAFDIIEHLNNEQSLLKELNRILKLDGIMIGSVPHDNDTFLPAYNLTFYHRSDLTHKRYYVPATLKNALESAGFEIKIIQGEGGVSPHVIAEFFPSALKFFVKKGIGLLRRLGVINTSVLKSDLFFVAKKVNSKKA